MTQRTVVRKCRINRLHGGIDAIVASTSVIGKLADGFGFTEGPVWSQQGFLLFSDIPNNVILKWHPQKGVSEFRKPSAYHGHAAPPGAHIGSNGLTLDRQGRLIICEHGNRRLTRLEDGDNLTVLANKFEGRRLNSPCDVVSKSDGALYFSDPPYGLLVATMMLKKNFLSVVCTDYLRGDYSFCIKLEPAERIGFLSR